ncbi:hypothetical protein [Blastopirellula marina]|uniref:NolW-like domain-containing protein n=1 Tax=Blastopirellula marina TaxID=124 RepID=A0A2S8FCW8_9BACT|nr:hypothetical protein [Blastopirellula marina]PQO29972.1 hypothetical protein C5Y98_22180 [Blastopirellula marina]PTL42440.1 hypothetical protein C5Y97_22190 [Blastopirellula marina]
MMQHHRSRFHQPFVTALALILLAISPALAKGPASQACLTMQQQVIDAKISVDVTEMRLTDFAELVERESKIPIRIDVLSLEENGLPDDAVVEARFKHASLHHVLLWTLRQLDLTYYVDSDEVVITAVYTADAAQQTRFHPVAKLLGNPKPDYDSLIDMSCEIVQPDSWKQLGGPGSIAPLNGGLVVSQITSNHLLLTRLYEQLVQAQAMQADDYDVKSRLVTFLPTETATLRTQLDRQQVEMAFDHIPLGEAIETVRKATGLNLVLDIRALEDIGLDAKYRVTLRARKRSVARTLELLLDPLVFMVQDDVVVVTTRDAQESHLEIRVYPMRDLVWRGLDQQDPHFKESLAQSYPPITIRRPYSDLPYRSLLPSPVLDSIPANTYLRELITTTIHPESWEELGGPGSIVFLPSADCFVVSQTAPIHEKLADSLQQIRKHSAPLDLEEFAAAVDRENDEIVTATFSVAKSSQGTSLFREADMHEIARQIQKHVEPESWSSGDFFVETLQDNVTVRHRREVVREVLAWLVNHGIVEPRIRGGTCIGPIYRSFGDSPPTLQSNDVPSVPIIETPMTESSFGASPIM